MALLLRRPTQIFRPRLFLDALQSVLGVVPDPIFVITPSRFSITDRCDGLGEVCAELTPETIRHFDRSFAFQADIRRMFRSLFDTEHYRDDKATLTLKLFPEAEMIQFVVVGVKLDSGMTKVHVHHPYDELSRFDFAVLPCPELNYDATVKLSKYYFYALYRVFAAYWGTVDLSFLELSIDNSPDAASEEVKISVSEDGIKFSGRGYSMNYKREKMCYFEVTDPTSSIVDRGFLKWVFKAFNNAETVAIRLARGSPRMRLEFDLGDSNHGNVVRFDIVDLLHHEDEESSGEEALDNHEDEESSGEEALDNREDEESSGEEEALDNINVEEDDSEASLNHKIDVDDEEFPVTEQKDKKKKRSNVDAGVSYAAEPEEEDSAAKNEKKSKKKKKRNNVEVPVTEEKNDKKKKRKRNDVDAGVTSAEEDEKKSKKKKKKLTLTFKARLFVKALLSAREVVPNPRFVISAGGIYLSGERNAVAYVSSELDTETSCDFGPSSIAMRFDVAEIVRFFMRSDIDDEDTLIVRVLREVGTIDFEVVKPGHRMVRYLPYEELLDFDVASLQLPDVVYDATSQRTAWFLVSTIRCS